MDKGDWGKDDLFTSWCLRYLNTFLIVKRWRVDFDYDSLFLSNYAPPKVCCILRRVGVLYAKGNGNDYELVFCQIELHPT